MKKKRGRNKEFTHIGGVLQNVLLDFHGKTGKEMLPVFDIWDEAVGKAVAENTRPAAFKENILCVHVSCSTWIHHLQFLKPELIEKVNHALRKASVRDIIFKIGPI